MTHVTCRLTAKNGDQLRNPTLGNRVWAAFYIQLHIRDTLTRLTRKYVYNANGLSDRTTTETACWNFTYLLDSGVSWSQTLVYRCTSAIKSSLHDSVRVYISRTLDCNAGSVLTTSLCVCIHCIHGRHPYAVQSSPSSQTEN